MRFRPIACAILAGLAFDMTAFAQRPPSDTVSGPGGVITIIPISHGTVEVVSGSHVILVDPVRHMREPRFDPPPPPPPGAAPARDAAAARPLPGPMRPPGALTKGLYAGLAQPTLILITDIHDDHFDPEVIKMLRGPATVVVGPAVVSSQVAGAGVLGNGQTKMVDGIALEAVAMYNLTTEPGMTEPFHTKGRGNGYIVSLGGKRLYFAGDTSCTTEMKGLQRIDIAFLPMNLPFTMSAADAVDCARAFKPKMVYPYHYIGPDPGGPAEFEKALQGSGITVRVQDWYFGMPKR